MRNQQSSGCFLKFQCAVLFSKEIIVPIIDEILSIDAIDYHSIGDLHHWHAIAFTNFHLRNRGVEIQIKIHIDEDCTL